MKKVIIFTDGACIVNPGPGGYAALLIYGKHRKIISGGYRLTTNNRMEIMAAIAGLEALKEQCEVVIYSDSQYLVNAMQRGWVQKWKQQGWKRIDGEVANVDLWTRLLDVCSRHFVSFFWVRRCTYPEQEECDAKANEIAKQGDALFIDEEYEKALQTGKNK